MVESIKEKKITFKNTTKNFNFKIKSLFILLLLLNPTIKSNSYSIVITFLQNDEGKILNCGNNAMMDSDSFIPPNQIKINSGTKEIYDSDTLYDLSAAGTTVELFWENTEIINCASMFYNCAHIKAIDFSNFDTSEVATTAQMFDGCSNLESLNLEKFDTSKVTDMWSMFSACTSLTSLNLFNFHISAETDIEDIFAT